MDMPTGHVDSPARSASPSPKSPDPHAALTHFGAVDWARGHHEVCVVDAAGSIVLELRIADTPEAWADLRQRLAALKAPDGSAPAVVGFAIETCAGPAVERLLEARLSVFPLNPKAAERYRDRKAPSGSKNDRLDAFCFADALRTDGHAWRILRPHLCASVPIGGYKDFFSVFSVTSWFIGIRGGRDARSCTVVREADGTFV